MMFQVNRRPGTYCIILCLVYLLPKTSGLPEIIRVGGLFDTSDNELEMAFRHAIDRINSDRHTLSGSRLQAHVERVQTQHSYNSLKSTCNLAKNGIAAIFGPKEPSAASLVRSTCEALHLPHIEIAPDYRYRPSKFTLNLHPDVDVLSQAYLAFVKDRGWKSFTIVYEDNDALIRLRHLLRASIPPEQNIEDPTLSVPQKSVKITLKHFQESTLKASSIIGKYKKFLKDISNTGETNIVLDFPLHKIPDFIRVAQEVGMLTIYHNYLITSLDIHTINLNGLQKYNSNITGFTLVDPTSQEDLLDNYSRDWLFGNMPHINRKHEGQKQPLKTRNALLYDGLSLFAQTLHEMELVIEDFEVSQLDCERKTAWLLGKTLMHYMKKVDMNGLTGSIKLDPDGVRRDFELQIVELRPNGFEKVGTWNLTGMHTMRNLSTAHADALKALQSKTIIMTTLQNPPYTMVKENADQLEGNDRFEGFCVDLIYEIAKRLNFTYEIRLVKDQSYGTLNEKGEWNGMIGELINREADIAIADISITHAREAVVDFTMPFMNLGISILYKKPSKQDPALFSFLAPFSFDVWLCMATVFVGMSLVQYFLARISPSEWENPHPCDKEPEELENQFTLANSFWSTIGSMLQQGSDILPKAVSTRTLASIYWFFILIMISSYTANLAAFLTSQRMSSPISNARDLAKQSAIHYGCVASGSTRAFFQKTREDPYDRMWSFMESTRPSVFVESNKKGIERVLKGGYAFLMESTTIEYTVERNCELTQIGEPFDRKGYGIATPTGSRYRDLLSSMVIELQEAGVLHLLKERWWKEKGGGTCPTDEKAVATGRLGLANVGGVFVVLLIGVAFGCVIAVCEYAWKTMQISREDRDTVFWEMMKDLRSIFSCRGSQRPILKSSSIATGIDTVSTKTPTRWSLQTVKRESVGTPRKESSL